MHMSKHLGYLIGLAVFALVAGVVITWNGINYHYDANWYLVYARSIQSGEGLRVPISNYGDIVTTKYINQWPPFYPMVLALSPVELFLGARLLTIALLVLMGMLVYALALHATEGRFAATCATLLALSIPAVIQEGFAYSRSEAFFTVLGLTFLLLLVRQHHTPTLRPALWAAFLVVLLTLTRYVGVAFGFMGLAWALWWGWQHPGQRRWHPFIAFCLSFVPLGLYALYLRATTGTLTGTQTTADPFTLSGALGGLSTILIELLHGLTFLFRLVGLRSNYWALLLGLLLLGLFVWWAVRRRHRLGTLLSSTHILLVLYVVFYCAVFWLLGARSDIIAEYARRHYISVLPVLAVLIVAVLSRIDANRPLLVGLLAVYILSGITAWAQPATGVSYNAPAWRADELHRSLPQRLPANTLVHTQYTSYVSTLVGPDVPIRTFGSIDAFQNFACDDLTYPLPYTHAAFTLIDSAYLRDTPPVEAEDFLRSWAAPCGRIIDYANSGFSALLVLELDRDRIAVQS